MIVHVPAVDWNRIFDDTLRTGRLFRRALPSGRLIVAAQHLGAWLVERPELLALPEAS